MFFSNNIHSPCFYKVCVEHVCISTLMLALCSLAFAKGEVRLESVSLVQPVRAQQREGIARAHNLLNFGPPEGGPKGKGARLCSILPHMYSTPYLRGWLLG
jgi:hypothetical protein